MNWNSIAVFIACDDNLLCVIALLIPLHSFYNLFELVISVGRLLCQRIFRDEIKSLGVSCTAQQTLKCAYRVRGPGPSLTAFKDILTEPRCLWNCPINDSRRRGRVTFEPSWTSSGLISLGLSSILTIVALGLSLISCVHDKSPVVDDSDSGVR